MSALISCTRGEANFIVGNVGELPDFVRFEIEKNPLNASRYKFKIAIWTDYPEANTSRDQLISRVEKLIDEYREDDTEFDDERDNGPGNKPMERYA